MTERKCPECDITIPMCSCGVWDCGFYSHLGSDCPTERGASYRRQLEFSVSFRDAMQAKDKEALRFLKENYPDLFEERMERFRARSASPNEKNQIEDEQ